MTTRSHHSRSSAPVPAITLHNVGKVYGTVKALDTICLEIPAGSTLALFGPSGCGKTTTLRLVAGLERPDWGEIFFGDVLVSSKEKTTPPHTRHIGMVFQDLALWPHMTVARHIGFALPAKILGKAKRKAVKELLELMHLPKHNCYPRELSGGEKQRLAIARALAARPQILLMDEPFSSLDQSLKVDLLGELKRLTAQLEVTMIYVTHQWPEVLELADTVAIMEQGRMTRCAPVESFRSKKPDNEEPITRQPVNNPKIFHLGAIST